MKKASKAEMDIGTDSKSRVKQNSRKSEAESQSGIISKKVSKADATDAPRKNSIKKKSSIEASGNTSGSNIKKKKSSMAETGDVRKLSDSQMKKLSTAGDESGSKKKKSSSGDSTMEKNSITEEPDLSGGKNKKSSIAGTGNADSQIKKTSSTAESISGTTIKISSKADTGDASEKKSTSRNKMGNESGESSGKMTKNASKVQSTGSKSRSEMLSPSHIETNKKNVKKKSTVKVLEKGDVDSKFSDMPEWFDEHSHGYRQSNVRGSTIRRSTKASRQTLASRKASSAPKKTEIVRTEKKKKESPCSNIDEEMKKIGGCLTTEFAVISLELDKSVEIESEMTNNQQNIYRPPTPEPKPKKKRDIRRSEINLKRYDDKIDAALTLLVDKMKKGLLARPPLQRCNTKSQYGVDTTPTESLCPMASSKPTVKFSRITTFSKKTASKIMSQMMDEGKSVLDTSSILSSKKIRNTELQDYLKQPMAKPLLRKVGVIDSKGELVGDVDDFNEVEHKVKTFMVELAKTVQDRETIPKPVGTKGRMGTSTTNTKSTTSTKSASMSKSKVVVDDNPNERRAHMREILMKEIAPTEPVPEASKTKKECIPVGAPGHSINLRGKSVGQDHVDRVVQRFTSGLEEEDDDRRESLLEILPFENRESFDQEPENGCIIVQPKTSQTIERIHGLLFDQIDLDDEDISLDNLTKAFRSEPVDEMALESIKSSHENLEETVQEDDKKIVEDDDCNPFPFKSQWEGPYPQYVVDRIRERDRNPNYVPKSYGEFYGKVGKMQADMYDSVQATLDNWKKSHKKRRICTDAEKAKMAEPVIEPAEVEEEEEEESFEESEGFDTTNLMTENSQEEDPNPSGVSIESVILKSDEVPSIETNEPTVAASLTSTPEKTEN